MFSLFCALWGFEKRMFRLSNLRVYYKSINFCLKKWRCLDYSKAMICFLITLHNRLNSVLILLQNDEYFFFILRPKGANITPND